MATQKNVFISYSRKDKDFVKKLVEAFEANKRDVWVDWNDIPPTADWMSEIYEGIESSETFVFIISPDSIKSKIVQMELNHALRMSKRLVPILYRELGTETTKDSLHPTLSAHNWLFVHDDERFDTEFKQVINAIDTDLQYVSQHTRLLVRAREWDTKNKDTSLLLNGRYLSEAQNWLNNSVGKEPTPTDLHKEYIESSHRAQLARRRLITAVIVYAVSVALLLAIAIYQTREANTQREEAEIQRQLAHENAVEAQALSLASNSLVALDNSNSDLAIILSLISTEMQKGRPEAEFALAESAYTAGTRYRLQGHSGAVVSVDIDDSGTIGASGSWDNTIQVWDLSSGTPLLSLTGSTDKVNSIDISADGQRLLSGSHDTTITYWDLTDNAEFEDHIIRNWQAHQQNVVDVAFVPGTQTVLSIGCDVLNDAKTAAEDFEFCTESSIILWDLRTTQEIRRFEQSYPVLTTLDVSPDGKMALIGWANAPYTADKTGIVLWDIETGELIRTFASQHTDTITDVVFSPDGTQALSASQDATVVYWDVESGEPLLDHPLEGHTDWVFSVDFSPDGLSAISGSADNTLILWDLKQGLKKDRFFGHSNWVLDVVFSPDARYVLSGPGNIFIEKSHDTAPRLWDIVDGSEKDRFTLSDNRRLTAIAVSPDNHYILTGDGNHEVLLWDSLTGEIIRTFEGHQEAITDVGFNPDGTQAVSSSRDDTIILWDVKTGDIIRTFKGHESDVLSIKFNRDGQRILSGAANLTLYLWDVESGDIIQNFEGQSGLQIRAVDFHPDGQRILSVSGGFAGTLNIWDIETGDILFSGAEHKDTMLTGTFSPDGRYIVTGSYDNTMILWDASDGSVIKIFAGHTGPVRRIAFKPDSQDIISGSDDGTIRSWDIESALEIRRFIGHTEIISDVTVTPDNTVIVSSSNDGTLRLWHIHTIEQLTDWIWANRYVRPLTCNEAQIYHVTGNIKLNTTFDAVDCES